MVSNVVGWSESPSRVKSSRVETKGCDVFDLKSNHSFHSFILNLRLFVFTQHELGESK